jgi:hypothetical protein
MHTNQRPASLLRLRLMLLVPLEEEPNLNA